MFILFYYIIMKLNLISKKWKLLIAECIRVTATIIILYRVNIPIYLKIILIMLSDKLDCEVLRLFMEPECDEKPNEVYQKWDKITDIICYTILLFYILNNGGLSSNYNYLIIVLFIFRLIGTYLFLIKNDRKYLFYFPNFFLEICVGLMVIQYYPKLKKCENFIMIYIIIYKIIEEYYRHIEPGTIPILSILDK